jgi:hypothetical protein
MKFDMGVQTLSSLNRQTQGSSDELTTLIRSLVLAAEPLEGKFNGNGRVAFDSFKNNSEMIAAELRGSLNQIVGGQVGLEAAYSQGDNEFADNATSAQGTANFDAARFSSSR